MNVTILSGTNRPGSNTRKVAAEVEGIYEKLGNPAQMLDLAKLPPEIFHPDSYADKPPAFQPINDLILDSDGVVVITPEYNGAMPGILKYFIDMLQFPESFDHRPVCFIGVAAGMWGAFRPIEQLAQVFTYRNGLFYPKRVYLPKINSLLDENGKISDPGTLSRLEEQAKGFLGFIEHTTPFRHKETAAEA